MVACKKNQNCVIFSNNIFCNLSFRHLIFLSFSDVVTFKFLLVFRINIYVFLFWKQLFTTLHDIIFCNDLRFCPQICSKKLSDRKIILQKYVHEKKIFSLKISWKSKVVKCNILYRNLNNRKSCICKQICAFYLMIVSISLCVKSSNKSIVRNIHIKDWY